MFLTVGTVPTGRDISGLRIESDSTSERTKTKRALRRACSATVGCPRDSTPAARPTGPHWGLRLTAGGVNGQRKGVRHGPTVPCAPWEGVRAHACACGGGSGDGTGGGGCSRGAGAARACPGCELAHLEHVIFVHVECHEGLEMWQRQPSKQATLPSSNVRSTSRDNAGESGKGCVVIILFVRQQSTGRLSSSALVGPHLALALRACVAKVTCLSVAKLTRAAAYAAAEPLRAAGEAAPTLDSARQSAAAGGPARLIEQQLEGRLERGARLGC